tara:strand:+ start:2745 stop:4286 length:1542 start_codon:yes stop_codon:yes gene_type:complete
MNDTFILNVNKLYRNKTYLEKYAHSVFITTIILLAFIFVFSYFYIKANLEPIRKDWNNLKCHPGIIPFAGMINKNPDDTVFQSTSKNFSLCTNLILKSVVKIFTKPVTAMMGSLNGAFKMIVKSGGRLQKLTAETLDKIEKILKYFLNRLGAIIIPVQRLFINIKDTLNKMNGVLATIMHTLLAQFNAMKSYIATLIDVIIIGMIASSLIILKLWLIPFSWPVAIPATVFYVVIMTFMIIIKVNMSRILLISSGQVPAKPGKPSNCFHKDTMIKTKKGETKISELNPGDVLMNDDIVTGVFKTCGLKNTYYDLNGTIVTGNHHVYNSEIGWGRVKNDPRAIKMPEMKQQYVYCLNTKSKKIKIKEELFMDWDEVDITDILTLKNKKYIYTKEDINNYLNSGFLKDTLVELKNGEKKKIQDLNVGEILKQDIKITGVVKSLDHKNTFNYLNKIFDIKGNNIMFDKSNLAKYDKTHIKNSTDNILYHIITDKTHFFLDCVKVYDYNACLEYFLNY